eukprot:217154_1
MNRPFHVLSRAFKRHVHNQWIIRRNFSNKVLIVGGGPCGAMTALSLHKHGIKSMVFERKHGSFEDEGSGMLLHGGGECMKYLGLKNELYSISSRNDLQYKSMSNNVFLQISNSNIFKKYGIEQRWCLRKDLFSILQKKCMETDGIEYYTNKKLVNYTIDKNSDSGDSTSVTAYFDDNTHYTGNVLVGCDGINSKVRSIMKGPKISKECKHYSGYSFWYLYGNLKTSQKEKKDLEFKHNTAQNTHLKPFNIDDLNADKTDGSKYVATFQTGDNCFGLFFPILAKNEYALLFGYRSEIDLKSTTKLTTSTNTTNNNNNNDDGGTWGVKQSKEELKDWFENKVEFNKMSANNNGIFEKYIENAYKINKFSVHNVIIDGKNEEQGKWYDNNNRVILLGDAAHAITPFGGHGCNLAFYDAICFGYLCDKYDFNNINFNDSSKNNDIMAQIFDELYNIRSNHSYEVSSKAQRMGKIYSLPKEKHTIRDNLLSIANKLGIAEKMVAKLCHPKVGFDILKETKKINENEINQLKD